MAPKHKKTLIKPHASQKAVRAKCGLVFQERAACIVADDLGLLNKSEDFIDLVRIMRLSNVLNYAFDQVSKEVDQTSSAGRLAFTRSRVNLGGYLHESIKLLENLRKRHPGKSYFSQARRTLDTLMIREKEILKLMRNNAAFHLDHANYSTAKAIKKLDLQDWEFLAADSRMRKDQYYVFADDVDLNYIIECLKKFGGGPNRSLFADEKAYEVAILSEIFDVIIRLGSEIATATSNMAHELAKRLGLLK